VARILVIDDDDAVRVAIRTILDFEGHYAVLARDGRQGLEALDEGMFDLLIVDIFMPGMDGFETIRFVRQQKPGIPIIVISGASSHSFSPTSPDFLGMATKLGAVRSLRKPFKHRELKALIEECIGGSNRNPT
jgi:CheY-like chemotaxis protein